ncbi:MAG: cytochrome c3 family protein [Bacteroidales bacterium]|nr:cytochrome c3 family protein [Bacteroidales bacterium]
MKCLRNICIRLLLGMGMIFLSQCSPYAGKSLLHFFFDGVPDADTISVASADPGIADPDSTLMASGQRAPDEAELFIHYPYGERECASCHNKSSLGSMTEPQPALCYICHEDLTGQFNYLHGPVAGGVLHRLSRSP